MAENFFFFITFFFRLLGITICVYNYKKYKHHPIWLGIGTIFLLRIITGIIILLPVSGTLSPLVLYIHRRILPFIMSGLLLVLLYLFNGIFRSAEETEAELKDAKKRYYNIFNHSEVSLTEEDVDCIRKELSELISDGLNINDLREYFKRNSGKLQELITKIKILDINERTLRMFKAESKEELITNYASTFTEESLDVFVELLVALAEGKRSMRIETVLKDLKGEKLHVLMKVSLPRSEDERIAIVSVVDITELKRLESRIIEERDLAQKYLNIAEVLIVVYDTDGIIRQINRKGCELLGYTEEELIGRNWFDTIILPENRGWLKKKFSSIMNGSLSYEPFYEEDLLAKNGGKVRVSWRAVALYDENGRIEANLCSGMDVTELRQKEDKLRKSELRSKVVEKLAKIGYWEVDVINNKYFWSEENYRMLGLEPGKVTPHPSVFEAAIYSEDLQDVKEKYERSVREHIDYIHEYRLKVGDEIKYISEWAHHSYDEQGHYIYTSGLAQNITEQVLTARKLEKSLKEKDALLRELHHRTKNNMQVISALLNLKAGETNDIRISSVFLEMDRKIQSMAMAHEKLYKSKDLSHINFKEYFEDLLELLKESYGTKKRGIKIIKNIDDVHVLIDIAVPCGLILNELVTNSLKHAFPGRRNGIIEVSLKEHGSDSLILSVADDGIGIEKDIRIDDLDSLGMRTIIALGEEQLQGSVTWETEDGVVCSVAFKNDVYSKRI